LRWPAEAARLRQRKEALQQNHTGIVSARRHANGVPCVIRRSDALQTYYGQDIPASRPDIVGHCRASA